MELKKELKDEILALCKRIRAVRKAMKLSLKDMAAVIGMSTSYLAAIETGNKSPGPEFFLKLIKEFDVNPNYLLRGSGGMFLKEARKAVQGFDFKKNIDNVDELVWLLENSPFFKSLIMGHAAQVLLHNEDTIKLSIKKNK